MDSQQYPTPEGYNPQEEYKATEDTPPVELTPMTLGEIFDKTINLFKNNFSSYLLLSFICFLPTIIISVIQGLMMGSRTYPNPAMSMGPSCIVLLMSIPAFIGMLVLYGSLIIFTSETFLGKKITIKEAMTRAWKSGGNLFVTILLMGLAVAGVYIVGGMGVVAMGTIPIVVVRITLMILVGILLLIGVLYMFIKLSLAVYVTVIENINSIESLNRSWNIIDSADAFMKVLLVIVFMQILVGGISWIFMYVVPLGLGSIFNFLLYPLPLIANTLVYYDIRIRKEGLDLEYGGQPAEPGN